MGASLTMAAEKLVEECVTNLDSFSSSLPAMPETSDTSMKTSNKEEHPALSKRQRKKMERKEKWLATKEERKQREKEKLKQKKIAKREAGEDLGPSRKLLKLSTMATSLCRQRFAVDMDFEEFMNERDQCKAIKQLHRCYSCNRRANNPAQLYFVSLKGSCLKIMEKNNGYQNWDVHLSSDSYLDIFPKGDIVYLSSESENVLQELDESKVYVIGGLVDHNNHKGLCHRLALERGISHARLPIDEYMHMKTRKVLTIDHVFQILLAVTEGKTWKEAFSSIIPARKRATAIDGAENSDASLENNNSHIDDKFNSSSTILNNKNLIATNGCCKKSSESNVIDDSCSPANGNS